MYVCVGTHIGNSREKHEDNFLIGKNYLSPALVDLLNLNRELYLQEYQLEDEFCVAVSDGMGGHECGDLASHLTVKYLSEHYDEIIDSVNKSKDNNLNFISQLNSYVCNEATKDKTTRDMGATVCGVISAKKRLYGFNVGDSRLYSYYGGLLQQISKDNTEGQRLIDLGFLNSDELKSFPNKKSIYKYIGIETPLVPDVYDLSNIRQGALIVLCTDGLTDALESDQIQEVLAKDDLSTYEKVESLVEMAVRERPGSGDNVTLIVMEC